MRLPRLHNDHKELKKQLTNDHGTTQSPISPVSSHPGNDPPQYLDAVGSSKEQENGSRGSSSSRRIPVIRKSSSNVLRAMAAPQSSSSSSGSKTPRRNVPYRPSLELQKHIDRLGSSSEVGTDLTTTLSGTRTDYFHVLPSFQMFQSILKRDDAQFNESLSGEPPTYEDSKNSSPTATPSLSPQTSATTNLGYENNLDSLLLSTADRLNEYQMNDSTYQEQSIYMDDSNEGDQPQSPSGSRSGHRTITEPTDTYGHTVLDNIDRLPKSHSSPLDIQIYVTKKIPQPLQKNELETRLKEYSSGDVVNGYIVITNTSDSPVDFGLFMVSLEGTIRATEKVDSDGTLSPMRYKKVLMKKFLKMYDLNASYGYTHIPSSVGVEYKEYSRDNEGCMLGLPNERILQPFQKYKKFFTFTFPEKLLDNTCMHLILPHVLPPPSYGFDRSSFYHRGENVAVNKALGYGYLDIRGTPLLTKDYAFDDISISYTIEAKFIDKLNAKNQSEAVFEHEINDPSTESDYTISRSQQYFLRFIPDLKEQILDYYNQGYQYGIETFGTLGIGGKLFHDYIHQSTWKAIKKYNDQIESEIDSKLNKEGTEDEIKERNLTVHEDKPVLSSDIKPVLLEDSDRVRDTLYYQDERMISGHSAAIYGKKKKSVLSSLALIGELKVYVQVPDGVIPYTSPRLLMKYNSSTDDLRSPLPGLTPVSSTREILELYNREEKDLLRSVKITLQFTPNDTGTKPPQVSYIEANVVCWSYNCEYPLPVRLLYDFYYASPHEKPVGPVDVDEVEVTRSNLQWAKDRVASYISFLKSNKTNISQVSYMYMRAIQTLGIKKDTVKDFFKPVTHSTHPQLLSNEHGWTAEQRGSKITWTKDITVPLATINKNNVTLTPNFQSCLVGRSYCLQVLVKYKGSGGDQNEFADNIVKSEVPILVG